MKIKAIASIVLSAVLLSLVVFAVGCGETTPIENSGQSTVLEVKKTPAEYTAKEVAYGLAYKLGSYSTYRIDTTGETVAHKGFITYTQTTNTFEIKNGDEAFTEVVSDSALVHTKHQVFAKSDKAVYRNDTQGELSVASLSDYKSVYGVAPGEGNVGSYILNGDSIAYAERVESESKNGLNVYRYMLNTKAMAPLRMQMKQFGGLADYPVYSDEDPVEVTVTLMDDWTPVSVVSKQAYRISVAVLGEMECTQNLVSTFSSVNGSVSIPGSAVFNAKIGETPTVVKPAETPDTDPAIEGLVASLVEKDLENGVRVMGTASAAVGGISVTLPVDLGLQFDLAEYASSGLRNALRLSFKTKLIGSDFAVYLADSKLYVNALGNKNVFDLSDTGAGGVDMSAFDKLGGMLDVKKTDAGYAVSFRQEIMTLVNLALAEYGVTLDNFAIVIPVSDSGACGIVLTVKGTEFAFELDTVLADYPFSLPTDMDDYVSGFGVWEQGKRFQLVIRTEATGDLLGYPCSLPIDIMVKLDSKALFSGNIAGAVNAQISIDLMKSAQTGDLPLGALIKMAVYFIPDLDPAILEMIAGEATVFNIYYVGDGNLYIEGIVGHDYSGDPIDEPYTLFVKTYALGDLIKGGSTSAIIEATETEDTATETPAMGTDKNGVIDIIGKLISGIKINDNGFSITLPDPVVSIVKDLYNDVMADALASMEGLEFFMSGFLGDINDITFDCVFDENGNFSSASLTVKLLQTGKAEAVDLIAVTFSDQGELDGELDGNADYIQDMLEQLKSEEGGEELAA